MNEYMNNEYPRHEYKEITSLCSKGNVVLVQNQTDGNLYVKKELDYYNLDIYKQLQKNHINNTPIIYHLYEQNRDLKLIVIEEYITGSTIAELLEEKGVFTEEETISVAMGLCKILMDLHSLKPPMIHRDIKPSNVMISSKGEVKLIDFNAAKEEDSLKGRDTVLIGTAGFAAPEQYGFASSTLQTDIYSIGVLLNIMLTGVLPSVKKAEGKLKNIILRCIQINPKDRFKSVKELYDILKRMSFTKKEWLLPGFRTMKIYKMIIALLGYGSIITFVSLIEREETESLAEFYLYNIAFVAYGFFMVFFYCNYLNIQSKIPFVNSNKKSIRIAALILMPVIAYFVMILAITVVTIFFFL